MAGYKRANDKQPSEIGKNHPSNQSEDIPEMTPDETEAPARQLQIHQVEPEAQVEELKRTQEELQQSRDKYQELYDSIPVGYFTIDKDYLILEANAAAAKLLGTTVRVLQRSKFTDFIAPTQQSQDAFHLLVRKIFDTVSEQECESEMQRVDSGRFYAHLLIVLKDNVSRQNSQLHIMVRDITQRKKAEEALRESEARFRSVLENSRDFIYRVNLKTDRFDYESPSAEEILGYSPDELMAMDVTTILTMIHPDDLPAFQAAIDSLKDTGKAEIEYRQRTKRGDYIWLSNRMSLVKDSQGFPLYRIGNIRDITERKKMEEALAKAKNELEIRVQERTKELQESRNKYQNLIETTSDFIWEMDAEGRYTYCSPQMKSLWGYEPEEILGKTPFDVMPPGNREKMLEAFMEMAKHPRPFTAMETISYNKQGQIVIVEINGVPFFNKDGQLLGYRGVSRDITKRKGMEQELKDYAQKITAVQEEERKRIAYELHDDTAQYLALLKLELDSLINSGKIRDPAILAKLQYLEKDAGRAVDDVRRYSHELRPGVLEHLGLHAALEQIAEDINNLNQIKVEVDVQGKEPKLSEEVKLGFFRIAQESLNNVRKHAKAEKAVISLKYQKKFLRMVVIDNGTGFDTMEAKKRSSSKGSLGLMSMQERADLIGANLRIESKPGKGTIVRVEMSL